MKTVFFLLILLVATPFSYAAGTDATSQTQTIAEKKQNHLPTWYERFQPYELNYAIWQASEHDEQAIEAQYSFRYNIIDHDRDDSNEIDFYLSYTGKFDFYLGTRESGPVINRASNPAIHGCYYLGKDKWSLDLGLEHRSDGQVADAKKQDTTPGSPTFGQYITQIEHAKGNHQYFDGISRGANYVTFTPGMSFGDYQQKGENKDKVKKGRVELNTKLFYFDEESAVTWGKYAGTGVDFSDFDLFRLKTTYSMETEYTFLDNLTLGTEYVIGKKGLATDSIDLYAIIRLSVWDLKFPLMVKSHFGPMDRLSNYTESIWSLGGGLALAY